MVNENKFHFAISRKRRRQVSLVLASVYLSHLPHTLILLFTICRHLPDNVERQEVRTECEHDGDSCDAIADTANRQSFAQPGTIHDTARGEFASLQRREAAKQFLNWIVDTSSIEATAI